MLKTPFRMINSLQQFFPFLRPLLSEMYVNEDDGSWWLLDSGASTTVMSSKHLGLYKAQ